MMNGLPLEAVLGEEGIKQVFVTECKAKLKEVLPDVELDDVHNFAGIAVKLQCKSRGLCGCPGTNNYRSQSRTQCDSIRRTRRCPLASALQSIERLNQQHAADVQRLQESGRDEASGGRPGGAGRSKRRSEIEEQIEELRVTKDQLGCCACEGEFSQQRSMKVLKRTQARRNAQLADQKAALELKHDKEKAILLSATKL